MRECVRRGCRLKHQGPTSDEVGMKRNLIVSLVAQSVRVTSRNHKSNGLRFVTRGSAATFELDR